MAADVVVLLGSRWADLEEHGTRWRHVLVRWAEDDRVGRLSVVDFPRFGKRARVLEHASWAQGVRSFGVQVPGTTGGRGPQGWGWSLAGAQLRRQLGPGAARVAVAATPISTPLLGRLGATRTAFDGVDDWRAFPAVAAALPRVEHGYRTARRCDSASTVSDVLRNRLARDFGISATTIGNGVTLAPGGEPPPGLPDGPFAVYVGNVQQRVDFDLLAAVGQAVPVVVAGPADGEHATLLRGMPVTWLGPIPVSQVPALLRRASVGLLPHRLDDLTTSMAPMKLLEYVASGLRCVSTPLPDVERHPGVVVARDHASFVAEVASALRRRAVDVPPDWLLEHDWDTVAERLLRLHVLDAS